MRAGRRGGGERTPRTGPRVADGNNKAEAGVASVAIFQLHTLIHTLVHTLVHTKSTERRGARSPSSTVQLDTSSAPRGKADSLHRDPHFFRHEDAVLEGETGLSLGRHAPRGLPERKLAANSFLFFCFGATLFSKINNK